MLQEQGLPVDDAPEEDDVRETYNFAPGYYGLVYRADVPDYGFRNQDANEQQDENADNVNDQVDSLGSSDRSTPTPKKASKANTPRTSPRKQTQDDATQDIHFHLKAMRWGLIPFWTKRSPDYGSMMRTINCRDDSLIENRGMWNTMKQRKRCIVICQGFYEWLKKGPGGKEKIPHFVKRKDGQLMCFAGLWDCVRYEDAEDSLYTYTIITTDSNPQLRFLHDRMPVIFNAGSKEMATWLDPGRATWSKELQILLKPFEGKLECYPVSKDVGKVGNNSPDFLVPVDSKENKSNIANFFGNAAKKSGSHKGSNAGKDEARSPPEVKVEAEHKVKREEDESRDTQDHDGSENKAPLPVPKQESASSQLGTKRSFGQEDMEMSPNKASKKTTSPSKSSTSAQRKARSATSNGSQVRSSAKKAGDGSQRITNFFTK
ncbi:hypothetical protein UCRPC4_g03566 [Phaeomoniella chlamydospora]|uniref:DUF159 domain protein n=1 Tax=Phaeomoniella chlamydospora TaxID=158046 RepID=A0A0G2GYA3_PHACM|nr:hypothetical protein UCRPC4_g03566 [Phaeomoniella chlamydospora]